MCEDAFITLRTTDNILNGHGPVWNVGERVQAYTHPLWLALITILVAILADPYITLISSSALILMGVLIVVKKTRQSWNIYGMLCIASLLWSRAFIDYSSSGLENPLTHLLLATFVLTWLRGQESHKGFALSLLTSALYLNRPDSIVLVAPTWIWHLLKSRQLAPMMTGLTPALAWTFFSLLYYGSAVPNTALAKVATGLPVLTKLQQAGHYLEWSIVNDSMTIIIIATGAIAGLARPELRTIALGLISWSIYLCYVGADYMGGRFFSAAALLGAVLLAHTAKKHVSLALVAAMVATVGNLKYTVASPSDFQRKEINDAGIADERGFYYLKLGLIPSLQEGNWQTHRWFTDGVQARKIPGIYTRCTIGMTGYAAGPDVYIIDPLALTDPFLARLPSRSTARIGHYERAFPEGYLASRAHSRNELQQPALHDLYADVLLVTHGADLWTANRMRAIWRLNSGHHLPAQKVHHRNAIGLPGVTPKTDSIHSCFGIPYGGDGFYRINPGPITTVDILQVAH